jgi:enamine deaminase RidA (YjgF/YER057c/UK114 family)
MKKVISTEKAPKAIGPYSQAIEKKWIFVSLGSNTLESVDG